MCADTQRFVDGQILPIIWMELSSGNISEDLRSAIYHSTFSANAIQFLLRYVTLLLCVTTFAMLIVAVYCRMRAREAALKLDGGGGDVGGAVEVTKKTNLSVSE